MEYFESHLEKKDIQSNLTKYIEQELIFKNGQYITNDSRIIDNNRALHGDVVYIGSVDDNKNKVVGIKKRSGLKIVGILHLNKNQKYGITKRGVPLILFTPSSNKFPHFMVPSKLKIKRALYVVISLNKWDTTNKIPIGQVEEVLGEVGDFRVELDAILYKNYVHPKLKSKTQKTCINSILDQEYLQDFEGASECEYETFSVDPVGCKDIDDAFHYRQIDDNTIEIGIHIADVAFWINKDKIDFTIFSSIYLDNGDQMNMLDNEFTYKKASLGNGDKRRAISLILRYSRDNLEKVQSFYFKRSIVKNRAISYSEADQIKEGSVFNLKQIAYSLIYNTSYRDITESLFKSLTYTKVVEHFMLLYNVYVAETLYSYDNHTILRNHKMNRINTHNEIDVRLTSYISRLNQNAANYIVNTSKNNSTHESLGFNFYTHATSPIRRWVDIINQINIVNYIENKPIVKISEAKIDIVNKFSKNLRRFYNNYEKLKIIFDEKLNKLENIFDAFIIQISKNKIKIFIPDLNIQHSCHLVSKKLEGLDIVKYGVLNEDHSDILNAEFNFIEIEGIKLQKYDKVKVDITILKTEIHFNKKIYAKIVEPNFDIL